MERHDDGDPSQQAFRRHRRAHLDLCISLSCLGSRLQPLLPRQGRRRCGGPSLLAGPCFARCLRTCMAGRSPDPRAGGKLPSRSGRRRLVVVPASSTDARILGIPNRQHGLGSHDRHPSGSFQPLSRGPRFGHDRRFPRVVHHGRRRIRRARIPLPTLLGGSRGIGQPRDDHELQLAALGRPRSRQLQDRSRARRSLPRRWLERHQGALGKFMGRPVRSGHDWCTGSAPRRVGRRRRTATVHSGRCDHSQGIVQQRYLGSAGGSSERRRA